MECGCGVVDKRGGREMEFGGYVDGGDRIMVGGCENVVDVFIEKGVRSRRVFGAIRSVGIAGLFSSFERD